MPRGWTKPTAFVVNTDGHTKPGMHWIGIYVDTEGNALYFDSYGLPPYVPDHIHRLRKNCKTFRWNTTLLQSATSDVCGQYCIMFLYYMSSRLGFTRFLENFSDDLKKNDDIVRKFVYRKLADGDDNECEFRGSGGIGCRVRCLQNCSSKMSLV